MSTQQRILTGITTTGIPHLGNYAGAIKPAVTMSRSASNQCFFFLADYHALVKCHEPERLRDSVAAVAATWLALGLDVDRALFYRQSDVPEICQLNWLLSCVAAKGLLNRAHAYKAAVAENEAENSDPDRAVSMGLFSYPVLMAADILLFNAHKVPVGADQKQHVEMARDIAQRFNHLFGERFVVPEADIVDMELLPGLDGRKMSKSYDNAIPLFCSSDELLKLIRRIKTNSQSPQEPKSTQGCALFGIYRACASEEETRELARRYADGIGWGEVKELLYELLERELAEPRRRYREWLGNVADLRRVLDDGAERARAVASPFLDELHRAVGISSA